MIALKFMTTKHWQTIFLLLFAMPVFSLPVWSEPQVRIVQPYPDSVLSYVRSSFVLGSVTPATATLTINGLPVTPHTNGGFLAMIPFETGKFTMTAVASDGVQVSSVSRTVMVQEPSQSFPKDSVKILPLSPITRVVLRGGDIIPIAFQGAPGGAASFRIHGMDAFVPLMEQLGEVGGLYKGVYVIQPNDQFDNDDIVFVLRRSDGKKLVQRANCAITVQRRLTPRIISIKEEATLLTGPDSSYGYHFFLLPGTLLEVTGEWGDFFRATLGRQSEGWIRSQYAVSLPAGTPPARSITRNIRVETAGNSTLFILPLQYRHPHRIDQSINPHRMRLTLYGVTPDTDRVRFVSRDSIIREVTWTQDEADTVTFNIDTKQAFAWGYDVRYEGNNFILEIRHKPELTLKRDSLKGLRVAVDAGHSKSSYGTIGPLGNSEATVNIAVAMLMAEEFKSRGAEVILTQDGTKEISLQDRTKAAWDKKAHLFISLHCDAISEGNNPRDVEGYSVHYYQPQSRPLAEAVYDRYGAVTGMRDQGLWNSNLAVCRMTQMPSILLEMGFLIIPELEEKLITPAFQKTIAQTVVNAVSGAVRRWK